jgi:hypothetical protein
MIIKKQINNYMMTFVAHFIAIFASVSFSIQPILSTEFRN